MALRTAQQHMLGTLQPLAMSLACMKRRQPKGCNPCEVHVSPLHDDKVLILLPTNNLCPQLLSSFLNNIIIVYHVWHVSLYTLT